MGHDATTRRTRHAKLTLQLNITLIIAFALLLVWSVVLVRDKLLSNANDMGTQLSASYAAEETQRFDTYETLLDIGAQRVEDRLASGSDLAEIQETLASYSSYLSSSVGSAVIDPYAVIDGAIVAAEPWEGDNSYNFSAADWYEGALKEPGQIHYTDVYQDAITKESVVTISRALEGEGNVIAFDILLNTFAETSTAASLPDNASYFLLDARGDLVYASTSSDTKSAEVESYLENMFDRIHAGELAGYADTVTDVNGVNRGVYYTVMPNGWLSILTIPIAAILQDGWDTTILALAAACAALVVLLGASTVREYLKSRSVAHISDTLELLGDTFYAIYRIDVHAGTYEVVKSSSDLREPLGKKGAYNKLLAAVGSVVEQSTHTAFVNSFSLDSIRRLFADGVREYGGDYQRRFGSTYKWVSIRMTLSNELGPDQAIMSFREINEEKRREIQRRVLLENALSAAEQASKRNSEIVSNVSHDMRTPLGGIIGLAELAQRDLSDPSKTARDLALIEKSGRQLLSLVNDVLDIARLEHDGNSALDAAPLDLNSFVRQTCELFEAPVKREGKTLEISVPEGLAPVMANELRLTQLLQNLVSNAVKYTEQGNRISVSLRRIDTGTETADYQFVVEDDGIGMTSDFLDHIFEPFARETMFSPTNVIGTGLGMPIVKAIVTQMDGDIAVESELGVGSRFTVTLPLPPAPDDTNPADKANAADSPDSPESKSAPNARAGEAPSPANDAPSDAAAASDPDPLQGALVLVADDNDINREIIQEYLSMLGAHTLAAHDGSEALEEFRRSAPGDIACILMDMRMPVMDGCTACEAIRAIDRPDARTVPIIAITANTSAEDVARTTAAGMNGHVVKPINFPVFAQVLRDSMR